MEQCKITSVNLETNSCTSGPHWSESEIHTAEFVKEMRRKVTIVKAYEPKFMFPYGFMTFSCAKWAVETVLNFSFEFAQLVSLRDKFTSPGFDFTLP
jgi:hypothetical protein